MHGSAIDALITECNDSFKQYVLAHAVFGLGQDALSGFPDSICVGATVGLNIDIEPIPMAELKHYRKGLPHFVLQISHGNLVQAWHECLSRLFQLLIDLHFSGKRPLTELRSRNILLDFGTSIKLEEQIKERLRRDFDFWRYSDRAKLLNDVFNPSNEQSNHLANIAKHIQIRNSFQHHGGIVDDFMLKELGLQKISLLDTNGNPHECKIKDKIELSVPEFNSFRQSILMIGQVWRRWNA